MYLNCKSSLNEKKIYKCSCELIRLLEWSYSNYFRCQCVERACALFFKRKGKCGIWLASNFDIFSFFFVVEIRSYHFVQQQHSHLYRSNDRMRTIASYVWVSEWVYVRVDVRCLYVIRASRWNKQTKQVCFHIQSECKSEFYSNF